MIGAWDEQSDADRQVVQTLTNEEFDSWIIKLRDVLHEPNSPISLRNGRWQVTERKELWEVLGTRIFDNDLDTFKSCVIEVLTECLSRTPLVNGPGCAIEQGGHERRQEGRGLNQGARLVAVAPRQVTVEQYDADAQDPYRNTRPGSGYHTTG